MDKDIRFTQKKVDESWKSQVETERLKPNQPDATKKSSDLKSPKEPQQQKTQTPSENTEQKSATEEEGSVSFEQFLNSIGVQAMIQLGVIPNPVTRQQEVDLEAARETIDIITMLKTKTEGNCTERESSFLSQMLYQLQSRYMGLIHEATKEAAQPDDNA